jgi:hypothetical protein
MEIDAKQAEQEFYLLDGWDNWLDSVNAPSWWAQQDHEVELGNDTDIPY